MLAVPTGSFLPLMVPHCFIIDNSFTEGSCLHEKFGEADCHVSTFGVDRAQRVCVTHREVCLKDLQLSDMNLR